MSLECLLPIDVVCDDLWHANILLPFYTMEVPQLPVIGSTEWDVESVSVSMATKCQGWKNSGVGMAMSLCVIL